MRYEQWNYEKDDAWIRFMIGEDEFYGEVRRNRWNTESFSAIIEQDYWETPFETDSFEVAFHHVKSIYEGVQLIEKFRKEYKNEKRRTPVIS